MSLKAVIETTEGLNEAFIPLYTEQDGKFYLQVEGIRDHPEVANLRVAYDRRGDEIKEAKSERDKYKSLSEVIPEDFDPAKWDKLKDGKADEAAQIKLKDEYEAKIAELTGTLTATQEAARKNAIDRDLTQELTAAGVTNPAFIKAAQTMLSGNVQVDDTGKPLVETDMGPMVLGDYVKRWVSGEGKDFVTAPKGGGSKSGDGTVAKPGGNLGGTKAERLAALANRFPEIQG